MRRVREPAAQMAWLEGLDSEGAITGYDAEGWSASTWILHAMYENPDLEGFGTHDDLHRRQLDAGEIAPLIIGDVDLESVGTVTGTPLGFVVRPGHPWTRITWAEYLTRLTDFTARTDYPPGDSWFPRGSWPVAIEPPPEGSLDGESFEALVGALAAASPEGRDTRCFAFYASLPARDFDNTHLWEGPLGEVKDLLEDNGGPYDFSPTNLWPVDRRWFVWTDYDLQGTKVSGNEGLIDALGSTPQLECTDLHAPRHDRS